MGCLEDTPPQKKKKDTTSETRFLAIQMPVSSLCTNAGAYLVLADRWKLTKKTHEVKATARRIDFVQIWLLESHKFRMNDLIKAMNIFFLGQISKAIIFSTPPIFHFLAVFRLFPQEAMDRHEGLVTGLIP